jgi:hypothetical protein
VIRSLGFDPKELGELATGRFSRTDKPFLNQIISSSFDVDKTDFVVRDSYHTGAGYGSVDVFRLVYTMDVVDGNMAAEITALPTLENLILARLESFRTIYFHRVCRAVHMMLLKALDLAKDDSASSMFTDENVRLKLEEEIATEAHASVSDVGIDVPSLPSVPYHYAMEMGPIDIPIFSRDRSGGKIPQNIGELSKVVDVLRVFMNIIRVYTKEQYRESVAYAATEILGGSSSSNVLSH